MEVAQRFAEVLALLRRQGDEPPDGASLVGSDVAAVSRLHKVWPGS